MNYFDNKAIVDKTYNGKAFGSNAAALPGTAYVDLTIDNLNNDMYLTYTDPATQEVHDVTLPTATTYKMENDFSNAFATDVVVTDADRVLIKANPNGVINMYLTDTNPLGFSFEKVNIKHYYVASEGVNGGVYVQDICVDTIEKMNGGEFDTDLSDWSSANKNNMAISFDNQRLKAVWADGTQNTALQDNVNITAGESGKVYLFSFDYDYTEVNCTSLIISMRLGGAYTFNSHNVSSLLGTSGTFSIVVTATADGKIQINHMLYDSLSSIIYLDNISLRELTASEIQNYTDACRTTYLNTNKGMSNLLLEQDASGRPTATLPDNTVDFKNSNGANINTGFKPSLPKMTIKEVVSGNLADLDSDGNPLGTFSERTEHRAIKIWDDGL